MTRDFALLDTAAERLRDARASLTQLHRSLVVAEDRARNARDTLLQVERELSALRATFHRGPEQAVLAQRLELPSHAAEAIECPLVTEEPQPLLLTTPEVADLLRLGKTRIYNLMNEHGLPSLKIGTRRFFDRKDIEAWIDQQKVRSRQ
jgi:excisionase family DNA binding protein